MTRYTATITHHSISRARVVNVGNTLAAAKINASREFGDEFQDYTIVIDDQMNPNWGAVASKRVGARRWIIEC